MQQNKIVTVSLVPKLSNEFVMFVSMYYYRHKSWLGIRYIGESSFTNAKEMIAKLEMVNTGL